MPSPSVSALSGFVPLVYFLWMLKQKGLLIAKYEVYRLALFLAAAGTSYLISDVLLALLPAGSSAGWHSLIGR